MFINRKKALRELSSDILKNRNINKVNFIEGNSGVGKSTFTLKVLELVKQQERIDYVKIKVDDHEGGLYQGLYLRSLASEINRLSKKKNDGYNVLNYIKKRPEAIKESLYDLISKDLSITNPMKTIISSGKKLYEYIEGKGNFSEQNILHNQNQSTLFICKEYIKSYVTRNKIVINIENFHLIDDTSLRLFSQIIKETDGIYYLLEVTKCKSYDQVELLNQLPDQKVDILFTELPKLSREEFGQIIKSDSINIERLIDKVYSEQKGNIKQLEQLKILVSRKNVEYLSFEKERQSDAALANILRIRKNSLFILSIIAVNSHKLRKEELSIVHTAKHEIYIDIDRCIKELEENELIYVLEEGIIEIAHDTFRSKIKENFASQYIVANKFWADHYQDLWKDGSFITKSKDEILQNIFYHLIESSPDQIINYLDDLKGLILSLVYPTSVKSYVNKLNSFLTTAAIKDSKLSDELYYFIIDIYYQTGFFEESLLLLQKINTESLLKNLFTVALLNRLDRHEDTISLCVKFLDSANNLPLSYTLSLQIILLTSYRSSQKIKLWENLNNKLINKGNELEQAKEYCVFLRNTEMYMSYNKNIEYLKKSVHIAKRFYLGEEEAYGRIALAMQLGRLGELKTAKEETEKARELLNHKAMDRHIILNNLATIEILSKNYSEHVQNMLKDALVTAIDSFSKINIRSNLLIIFIENKLYENCATIITELLQLIQNQKDVLLHRIVYWNIHYFYSIIKNENKSNFYMQKAIDCVEHKHELWRYRFYNTPILDKNYEFLAKLPHHADFLTHWHFNLNHDVKSYLL